MLQTCHFIDHNTMVEIAADYMNPKNAKRRKLFEYGGIHAVSYRWLPFVYLAALQNNAEASRFYCLGDKCKMVSAVWRKIYG